MRKTMSGKDMPTLGLTSEEVYDNWKKHSGSYSFGTSQGFSVHAPSKTYSFGMSEKDFTTFTLKKSWRVNGILVCADVTNDEWNEIMKEIEDGSFQIEFAPLRGVCEGYQQKRIEGVHKTLHQADGRKLSEHRDIFQKNPL